MYKSNLDVKFFILFYSCTVTHLGCSIISWPVLCGGLPFLFLYQWFCWQCYNSSDSVISIHHHWIFTGVLSHVANIGPLCRRWEMISWTLSVKGTWPILLSRTFPTRASSRRCCASWRVTWMMQSLTSSRWALAFSSHIHDRAWGCACH